MEKLNRAAKCSILRPQNLGSRGGPGPRGPSGSAAVSQLPQLDNSNIHLSHHLFYSCFVESDVVCELLWFIGDNFVAKSFRTHYKKQNLDYYIKENYDFTAYCNSKFLSSNENMLGRLENCFTAALNQTKRNTIQPDYVLIILGDDLISFLRLNSCNGLATLQGTWVQWLAENFADAIKVRNEQLVSKCRKDTFFYWVSAPTHSCFSKERNNLRIKFNLSLESVIKSMPNMRVIRIKDMWNSKDTGLVVHDRITEEGMTSYWKAIDASFKFNVQRQKIFLAKKMSRDRSDNSNVKKETRDLDRTLQNNCFSQRNDDLMEDFFRRNRSFERSRDRYGEHSMCVSEDSAGGNRCRYVKHRRDGGEDQFRNYSEGRFLLPRPKY